MAERQLYTIDDSVGLTSESESAAMQKSSIDFYLICNKGGYVKGPKEAQIGSLSPYHSFFLLQMFRILLATKYSET